ncbi:hypothetical protein C0Q70_06628 [Pomacea canaliculata]|uniref:Thioredoxin domain-containing protein n=1 Tax=Pomacea canaliculata TaxID=400727 RepID=A0A2T7PCR7_POMCA|nr:hypothetical protein C0Q70_06628 [Pomacea canaliculata]
MARQRGIEEPTVHLCTIHESQSSHQGLGKASHLSAPNKLTKKFRIQGIPRLVILDGETGKTITVDGFNHLMEDENGCAFPWKRKPFWEMIKGKLLHGDKQEEVDAMEALKGKIIGLYFAANWCPPCKFFTPELTRTYERLKEAGRNFEIVFVTSDRSVESFQQHVGCMPWLVIPFHDPRLQQITTQFGIDGIPSLVILDEKGGLITMNGRQAIVHDSAGLDFPWYPKPLNELTQMAAVQLNENICLILFTDGEEEELLEARAVLHDVAVREHQKGEDQELLFFYAGDDEFCDQVRDFAHLEDRSPLLVILDSPEQQVYVSPATDMSCEVVTEFVDSYLAGRLVPTPFRHTSPQEC